jgi:hypothetical protein
LEARKQAEGEKAIAAKKEEEQQKQFEAQIQLDAQKQLEAGRIRTIDNDLDKIDACLQRVLDEPTGYASETKAQEGRPGRFVATARPLCEDGNWRRAG